MRDQRREPLGGFVQHEQIGIGEQCPADGEHLLLAARELVAAMLEPRAEAREARERALERPRAIAAHAGARGHDQVLAHGQIGEDAASLGYVGDTGPRHAFGFRAGHVASLDANLAAARGDMAEERAQ